MSAVSVLPELTLRARGHVLSQDEDAFGLLTDSSALRDDIPALRQRMQEDGYLFLPAFFPREAVLEARKVVTDRLQAGGYLDPDYPPEEAVAVAQLKIVNARSAFRPPVNPGGGASEPVKTYIAESLTRDNKPLDALLYSGRLMEFFTGFLGGPIRHYDYTWFRVVAPGMGTPPHCDLVYMGRGTDQVFTTWTPLGDVPLHVGGLMILEHSHRKAHRLAHYLGRDVDEYCVNGRFAKEIEEGKKLFEWDGTLSKNPVTLREKLGGRWLTCPEYRAGDILIFTMKTIHASLDNQSDRVRISSDSRYQLASEPIDERYIGPNATMYSRDSKRGRVC
jgi:hypothetical protein